MALSPEQAWTLTKHKLDGSSRSWQAQLLGEDEYGHWLFAPAGTLTTDGSGQPLGRHDQDGVQLLPRAGWTAWWWLDGSITIDLSSPVQLDAGDHHCESADPPDAGLPRRQRCARYLDLELDLWQRGTQYGVADRDDYAQARQAGQFDDAQHEQVMADLADLEQRLATGGEPLAAVGWQRLEQARTASINLSESDDHWPLRFAAARARLLTQLAPGTRIEHIGSTAVPGPAAKDCIDIAVIVPSVPAVDLALQQLAALGYQRRPGFDDPGHGFARMLDQGRRTEHVHVYTADHGDLTRVLALRDLLRADARARQSYGQLKRELAQADPLDRGRYIAGKDALVGSLTARSVARSERLQSHGVVTDAGRESRVQLQGIELAVHQWGTADPARPSVLVFHGGPDVGHRYLAPGLAALGRDHHVVTFDFRGTGNSARGLSPDQLQPELVLGDALALLDELGLGSVDVIGFSTGGRAATELVRRAPNRVRRLVLASTSGMPPGAEAEYRSLDADHRRRLAAEQAAGGLLRNAAVMIQDLWQVPDHLARIADCDEGDWSYERWLSGEQHPWVNGDPVEILNRFAGPTLIVHGAHDRGFALATAQWLHDRVPGSRLAVLAGAAHLAPVEQPLLWAAHVRSFLRRI